MWNFTKCAWGRLGRPLLMFVIDLLTCWYQRPWIIECYFQRRTIMPSSYKLYSASMSSIVSNARLEYCKSQTKFSIEHKTQLNSRFWNADNNKLSSKSSVFIHITSSWTLIWYIFGIYLSCIMTLKRQIMQKSSSFN